MSLPLLEKAPQFCGAFLFINALLLRCYSYIAMYIKTILTYLIVFGAFKALFADNDTLVSDSVKYPTIHYLNERNFASSDSIQYPDYSLDEYSKYLKFNHLGNSGLPLYPLLFNADYTSPSLGFSYFLNPYSIYFANTNTLRFYNTRTPYTEIFYATGSKNEQVFKGLVTQNIAPNFNTAINFTRIRSDGFYSRQNTNDNVLDVSVNYKSRDNRYLLLGAVIYNAAKHAESGGMIESGTLGVTGTNLLSADKQYINKQVFIKQFLNIGSKALTADSINYVRPSARVVLTTKYDNNEFSYTDSDPTSGFYKDVLYDSTSTNDSSQFTIIDNKLEFQIVKNQNDSDINKSNGLGVHINNQVIRVQQNIADSAFNNLSVGIWAKGVLRAYVNWKVNAEYMLAGYNKENYSLSALLSKLMWDARVKVSVLASSKRISPSYIFNSYESNNFYWKNNFRYIDINTFKSELYVNDIDLLVGGDITEYYGLTYFNSVAQASQFQGKNQVLHMFINKNIKLKHWHLDNRVNYQIATKTKALQVPALIMEHSLYYDAELFHKALKLQMGSSINYVSRYRANAYMPATGQFYVQTNSYVADYPVINVFLHLAIKNVRIFVLVDHLNHGWTSDVYQLSPGYTMNNRATKFGFSWRFYD